jgi:hypothetical protein
MAVCGYLYQRITLLENLWSMTAGAWALKVH